MSRYKDSSFDVSCQLREESKWSPCLYSYLKAAHYAMLGDLTQSEREDQHQLMESVPGLKQRIAGKSLPMEKFAIRKAERWLAQGGRLTLPGLELVYLWNGFVVLGQHFNMVERYYVMVEEELASLQGRGGKFALEDECLLLLLKGVCLKYMSAPLAAEESLRSLLRKASKESLKVDKYLVPYATVELALLLLNNSADTEEAWTLLESAKNDYKDYSLQSRLHFRIHAAQNKLRAARDEEHDPFQEEAGEAVINLKEQKGILLRELENCSDSQIREMVPHI